MSTSAPARLHGRRPGSLGASLGISLAALATFVQVAPNAAAPALDATWVRFRADPAYRIFAELPAPRSTSNPHGSATTTRTVVNCADDGPGSLRATIAGASDSDIIDLAALACGTITLETGAIPIMVDSLTLRGPGRSRLSIDGNRADRVFIHPYGGSFTLSAMTIQHGHDRETGFDVAGGGCIASAGYVTLDDASVRDCYAGGEGAYGGGIYAYSLTMSNSTLSGNVALGVHETNGTAGFGGGAFVYSFQLTNSTVSGNRAVHHVHPGVTSYDIGGGIISVHGGSVLSSTIDSNYSYGRGGGIASFDNMTVTNSTFSGNVAATSLGGALFLRRPSIVAVSNSTLTANHAEAGGGIWLYAPTSTIQSSIVFGNSAGAGHFADVEDAIAVTIAGSSDLVGASGPSVALPADTLNKDPLLGPLANNGGPTQTHALRSNSPAVDAGSNAANLPFDQRGAPYSRVYGAAPDIGAFEQQPSLAPVVLTPVPTLSTWMMGLLATWLALMTARERARARKIQRRDHA